MQPVHITFDSGKPAAGAGIGAHIESSAPFLLATPLHRIPRLPNVEPGGFMGRAARRSGCVQDFETRNDAMPHRCLQAGCRGNLREARPREGRGVPDASNAQRRSPQRARAQARRSQAISLQPRCGQPVLGLGVLYPDPSGYFTRETPRWR